jgi:hypothetical protein
MNAFTFATVAAMSLWRAALVAHAMCGVIRQFFAVRRGLLLAAGSMDRTSNPAPAI